MSIVHVTNMHTHTYIRLRVTEKRQWQSARVDQGFSRNPNRNFYTYCENVRFIQTRAHAHERVYQVAVTDDVSIYTIIHLYIIHIIYTMLYK